MTANATIQYNVDQNRHLHKNEKISQFAVIHCSTFLGHIQCEKPGNLHDFASINIPALPAKTTRNITIKIGKGETLQIKSIHTDAICKIGQTAAETRARLDNQKFYLSKKYQKLTKILIRLSRTLQKKQRILKKISGKPSHHFSNPGHMAHQDLHCYWCPFFAVLASHLENFNKKWMLRKPERTFSHDRTEQPTCKIFLLINKNSTTDLL
jgi:hypothetical protein